MAQASEIVGVALIIAAVWLVIAVATLSAAFWIIRRVTWIIASTIFAARADYDRER